MTGQRALISSGATSSHVFDPDGLKRPVGRLQPLPTVRRRGDGNSAGHVHSDRLTRLLLDFAEKVDRIGLQHGHVRVRVQRMESAGRMPGRARRQNRSFNQRDVAPTKFGEMIEHGSAHDAAADDNCPVVRFHRAHSHGGAVRGRPYCGTFGLSRHVCLATPWARESAATGGLHPWRHPVTEAAAWMPGSAPGMTSGLA